MVAVEIERTDPLSTADVSGIVLDMLSAVLKRLASDTPCDDIPITHLGRAIEADAAVALAINPGGAPSLCAAYPDSTAAEDLVDLATSIEAEHLPLHYRLLDHAKLGHVIVITIRPDQNGHGAPGLGRVLAFARKGIPYGAEDRAILERACVPLASLWPHAARTYRSIQTGQNARTIAERYQLSDRELQVLALLAEGLLATSIASRLSLSPRTVHKHLGNIYRKLGVHDRLVAVSIARLYGLLSPDGGNPAG